MEVFLVSEQQEHHVLGVWVLWSTVAIPQTLLSVWNWITIQNMINLWVAICTRKERCGRQRQIWNYWQRLSLSLTFKEVITSVIGFSLCVDIQTMGVPRILKTTECSIMKVAYQVSVSYWNWPYQSKFYTLEWKAVVTHHKLTVNVFPIFLSNPSNCCCDIEFWTNRGALVAPQSL